MVFICEICRFIFERTDEPERCVDCGCGVVREANDAEILEYEKNKKMHNK